jgi:cephalosporin hydroxylase
MSTLRQLSGRLRRGTLATVTRRRDERLLRRAHRLFYAQQSWRRGDWLGTPALKNPLDLWVCQEIITETRPDLLVETGTFDGGSAFYFASLFDQLGAGRVVSIDVKPVSSNYPQHPRITYLGGRSSTDTDVVDEVRRMAGDGRVMVVLDSDHSAAHVAAELEAYAPLVTPGCYVVVEDSIIGLVRPDLVPGPTEALEAFLARTDDFDVDRSREKFLVTFNPGGFLRRVLSP